MSGVHEADRAGDLSVDKPASPRGEGELPLAGLLVVDFSQFLSGPCAALRLADLGARVIKIERPGTGDICRQLYVSDTRLDGESTTFHAINRNKESFVADLKSDDGLRQVRALLGRADVVMHNFRPGVMERLGLGCDDVRGLRPDVIYASITGYGSEGPWRDKPGQDLLVQSLSGLAFLSGAQKAGPVPMGLSIVDQLAGMQLAQGILACLYRLATTGQGGRVDVSMLESALDLQFELLTNYLQDGGEPVIRSNQNAAHSALGAPYGIYPTADGWLALAMGKIPHLGELLGCAPLLEFVDASSWFPQRDTIKAILDDHLKGQPTQHWLDRLQPADIWCAEVLDWKTLAGQEAFKVLEMTQTVERGNGTAYRTTRCPITLDGRKLFAAKGSPDLGEHTHKIREEFNSI